MRLVGYLNRDFAFKICCCDRYAASFGRARRFLSSMYRTGYTSLKNFCACPSDLHLGRLATILNAKSRLTFSMLLTLDLFAAELQMNSFQTHSHAAIEVDADVAYMVTPIREHLKVKGLRLVLSGLLSATLPKITFKDDRTAKIIVTKLNNSQIAYDFIFSSRGLKVGMDYFDYRSQGPSQVVLDYWLKNIENQAKAIPLPKVKPKPRPVQVTSSSIELGCGEPLRLDLDGVTYWKTYHRSFDYRAYFNLTRPDERYQYPSALPQKGENFGPVSKELAHYRLALKLYREEQFALVLRTIAFFEELYPKSVFATELEFLKASTFVRLSKLLQTDRYRIQAIEIFHQLYMQAPESEKGRASRAYLTQEYFYEGKYLLALPYAVDGAGDPEKPKEHSWVYRLAMAESMFSLGEFDRAERNYRLIMKQKNWVSPEAAFRVGEVFTAKKFWEQAVLSFEKAFEVYSDLAGKYPTAWVNLGEAYFRLGQFKDSYRVYSEYVRRFPADRYVWMGALRVAELSQIMLSATKAEEDSKTRPLYENVVNSYPYSSGAFLAELRASACRDVELSHGMSSIDFFNRFFRLRQLAKAKDDLIDERETEFWFDLAEARYHVRHGDFYDALSRADFYRPKLESIPLSQSFKKIYGDAIVGFITHEQDHLKVLEAVGHYGDLAPNPAPAIYHLDIAKAMQLKGDIQGVSTQIHAIESRLSELTDEGKDWFHLVKARQMKIIGEKPDPILIELAYIREDGSLGAFRFDEMVQASISKHDLSSALEYDGRIVDSKLIYQLSEPKGVEVKARRIENLFRNKQTREVVKYSDYLLLKHGSQDEYRKQVSHIRVLRALALYDLGKNKDAVEALSEILKLEADHPDRREFEFKLAKSQARLGKEIEALETFQKLAKATSDDVWKKSAQAELDQLQWERNIANQIKDRRSLQ